jgi:hypothetical protein
MHYRGLETLTAYFTVRRELLHRRFIRKWERLANAQFRERLLETL